MAGIGLQPPHPSGLPCNSSLLTTPFQLSKLQPAVYPYDATLTCRESCSQSLTPVAQHQPVTPSAPPGGLLPLPVTGSGRPTPIITVPSQGTHIGLAIWRLKCFYETFVQGSTVVILLNFCAKNPPHRQAANRCKQPY